MMIEPRKSELVALLHLRLVANLDALMASQASAQAGAVHEESRQEGPKDTRAIEATYLARALAQRVELLREGIGAIEAVNLADLSERDRVRVGALIRLVASDPGPSAVEGLYLLMPAGAGETFETGQGTVHVLTPGSPLGAALIGKQTDDEIEIALPGGRVRACVDEIA